MKICDVVQFYSPLSGGVKRYIRDKMRFCEQNPELEHFIIIPSHRYALRKEYGSRVYEIKSPPLVGSESYRMLIGRRRIQRVIAAEKPDIIEVGDPYNSAWVAARAGQRLNVPVVAYYHSDYPRALGRTIRRYGGALTEAFFARTVEYYLMKLYNHMDTTVVATDRMASILAGVGIERLRKIPLGADHTVFYPRHSGPCIRAELGIDDQAKLLLYVGRLAREKNIRSLLQMMPMLESEHDRYHLCLVGDGEQRDLVRQHCADRNDITLLPYASSEDRLAELYSAADLFVHAGTAETFGLVSVEAQSCGTRVLAIEGGGLDETLRGEQPLIMARDSSSESLAHAITCAILLGENAVDRKTRRDRMVRHFSSQRTYEQLIALYGRLSEKRHIPSAALQTERPAHALYHPVLHTS